MSDYLERLERKRVAKVVRELDASAEEDQKQAERPGHRCLVCEKRVTPTFWLCEDCQREFGRTSKDWPMWLKGLAADAQKTLERAKAEAGGGLVDYDEEATGVPLADAGTVPDWSEGDFPHGTETGRQYGCKCGRCKKAHADYAKARRHNV